MRFLSWALLASLLVGCNRSPSGVPGSSFKSPNSSVSDSATSTTTKISVQLNWFPESEHGGLYQAVADGTFTAAGFDVEIRPGGQATPVAPELVLGRCQFAIGNADDCVLFRNQDADVVAVLAAMQNHPRCIIVREDSGVESLDKLDGIVLQRQAGQPFVEFMRSRGLLKNVQEVPYHGSVAGLATDPKTAIQGYVFAEPLLAEQQGIKVRSLMLSDLGWNPYSSVLLTSGSLIRENPGLVRRFVAATQLGWKHYVEDPALGNALILESNKHGMTREALEYGTSGLRKLALPESMALQELGQMSLERWTQLVQQMVELKLVDGAKIRAEDCFTNDFIVID